LKSDDSSDSGLSQTNLIIIATAVPAGVIGISLAVYLIWIKKVCGGASVKDGFDAGDVSNPLNRA
jgi:hypothetical protein